MGIKLAYEKLLDIPIPPDGVSFGKLSAEGITTYLSLSKTILTGSYTYDTVTITLQGVILPPLQHPRLSPGSITFPFRGRTWTLLDVVEGNIIKIANISKYMTWACTGVDLQIPSVSIG
jgi:hypothetical protein